MGIRGSVAAGVALTLSVTVSGCLQLKNGVVSLDGSSLNPIQNCPLPNNIQVSQVARKLATASTFITPESCTGPAHYECYRRVFHPQTKNIVRNEQECTHLAELGGDFCITLSVQYFSTAEAAARPDVSAEALQPGGDYNRSEYVCHQKDLRDEGIVLANGLGDTLKESLANSYRECTGIAPRITAIQESVK